MSRVFAATVAANVAYGLPHGWTDALLSVWPVAAYLGSMELLAWLRAHTGLQPRKPLPHPCPPPRPHPRVHLRMHLRTLAAKRLMTCWPPLRGRSLMAGSRSRRCGPSRPPCGQPASQRVQAYFKTPAGAR